VNDLLSRAERLALLLKDRRETVAVAESSAGGLISAALLAVPGASGIPRGTPAWPSPVPSSALSLWKPVNGTASATCAPSPPRLWIC